MLFRNTDCLRDMAEKIRVSLGGASAEPLSMKLNSAVSGGKVTMPLPIVVQQEKVNISDAPEQGGKDAFSTGGAFNLQQEINKKANKEDIPTIPNIPTKLSELENDKEFVSTTELDERGFLTDEDIQEKGFITETALNNKGFLKEQDIEGLATEQYVNGIVGDINQVLDIINGEVV